MTKHAIGIGLTLSLLGFVPASNAGQTGITFDEGAAFGIDAGDVGALKSTPIVVVAPEAKEILKNVATVPNSSTSVVGTTGVKQIAPNAGNAR